MGGCFCKTPISLPRRAHVAEAHVTIPGELNVYGASLMGVPVINMGFNEHIAWTHTVSTNPRFVVYTLPLVDGDPTTYIYDGEEEEMSVHEFNVDVLQSDGTTVTETRELYRSRYGWMINAPSFGWPDTVGFTVRDINRNNTAVAGTWLDMNRADSLESFQSAISRNMGIPWVHTLATDVNGATWYADAARTPHFTPEAEAYFVNTELQENPFSGIFYGYGVLAVSGDNPIFELDQTHPDGIVPFEEVPKQSRDDYLLNANDNHWLSNHLEPLTGYSFVFGEENSLEHRELRWICVMQSMTGAKMDSLALKNFSKRRCLAVPAWRGSTRGCRRAVQWRFSL